MSAFTSDDFSNRTRLYWLTATKSGMVLGKTDDFAYNLLEDGLHVHDFHATVLHCLGINHEKLTYRTQGRDFRLTDVAGKVETRLLV